MKDREKILRYFAASGDESKDMAMRLLDLADAVDRGRPFAVGPFMAPFARQIGQTIAAHMKTVKSTAFGGYHEAERVRIAFQRVDYDGPVDFSESLLSVTWDGRYRLIGHRDVLGSLMGLGIDRSVTGDILMQGAGCQIVVDSAMKDWLMDNFKKVAMVPVKVEEIPLSDSGIPSSGCSRSCRLRHFPLQNGGGRGGRKDGSELAACQKRFPNRKGWRHYQHPWKRPHRNQGRNRHEPERTHGPSDIQI